MRNRTSDCQISCSNALPLSHRDSTESEVYYKAHMICVLHTARISNVDSVIGTMNFNVIGTEYMYVKVEKQTGKF